MTGAFADDVRLHGDRSSRTVKLVAAETINQRAKESELRSNLLETTSAISEVEVPMKEGEISFQSVTASRCKLRTYALQTVLPSSSFLQRGVAVVWQL